MAFGKGFVADRRAVVAVLLLLAVASSFYSHSLVLKEWHMPTFGNTMVHVAVARHALIHGSYPLSDDYSYGGGIPALYVPGYRASLIAFNQLVGGPLARMVEWKVAPGVDGLGEELDLSSRLLVLLFAILLPLGFYVLGSELFGQVAGVAAAFLCLLPSELLIYTVRPLPQSMGMVFLPLAFYLLWRGPPRAALFFAGILSLIHQEAAVFFAGCAFAYAVVKFVLPRVVGGGRHAGGRETDLEAWKLPLAVWGVATAVYLLWHFLCVGNFNILELAQFKYHEGAAVSLNLVFSKTGKLVSIFGWAGLSAAALAILRLLLDERKALLACFGAFAVPALVLKTQFAAVVPALGFDPTGLAVAAAAGGLSALCGWALLSGWRGSDAPVVFAASLAGVGLFIVKNDAIGEVVKAVVPSFEFAVFMDRFVVFLQEPLVLLAAFAFASVMALFFDLGGLKVE